jgi:hypothetical protein
MKGRYAIMNTEAKSKFAVKPVVAALALAFSAVNAYAAPTPIQQPGSGLIRALTNTTFITSNTTATTGFIVSGGGVVGEQIWDGYADSRITLNNGAGSYARAVITWGPFGTSFETRNPAGFNVGASAVLTFGSAAGITDAAVLNVDTSGNQSEIYGRMEGISDIATPGAIPRIFVANGNGIIVGAGAHIIAPTGVGLIGANLNNSVAWNDFIANNGVVPADLTTPGTSYLNVNGTMAPVSIHGAIDGNAIANAPAPFILIAGSTVTNTGNLFGNFVAVVAGVTEEASKATVNGVTNVTVNRLWDVDADTDLLSAPEVLAANAGGSFVNTGSISAQLGSANVGIAAANGIRSGTLGSADQTVGIFADGSLILENFDMSGSSAVELYNVVSAYTQVPTPDLIDTIEINQYPGTGGDVTINALTRASQGSSLWTEGPIDIYGKNIAINSTINHVTNTANFNEDLDIVSSGSLTTTAAIGAGNYVRITNTGAGGINIGATVTGNLDGGVQGGVYIDNAGSGAPTTISGDLISLATGFGSINVNVNGDLDISGSMSVSDTTYFAGEPHSVYVTNNKAGAKTSITSPTVDAGYNINVNVIGPLTVDSHFYADNNINIQNNTAATSHSTMLDGVYYAGNEIYVSNLGSTGSNLVINGDLSASNNVHVWSGGDLTLGMVDTGSYAYLTSYGHSQTLNGPITAGNEVDYYAAYGLTLAKPAAVITAPYVYLETLNFRGVNSSGNAYLNEAQKPVAQIVADWVSLVSYGSFNAPIAGNTNWPKNSIDIMPLSPGGAVGFDMSAVGGGFQAINVKFLGDAYVTSGATQTPFQLVGLTSSSIVPPFLTANGGSQLILHATGNMDIDGVYGFYGPLGPYAFQFPGGIAFIAEGYLSQNVPVYNAWTTNGGAFQGVFYESPNIIASAYTATNDQNWVNYSSYPATGPSQAFIIHQTTPGLYQFVNTPDAIHNNTYTRVVTGAPFCTTPNPPAPWAPGC